MKWKRNSKIIGMFFVVTLLLAGLFVPGPAGAQIIQQAQITLQVDPAPPNFALNCGDQEVDFNWTITFDSTPDFYLFYIEDPDEELVDPPGMVEVDITGQTSPVVGNFTWSVPAGSKTGIYTATVEYYSEEVGEEVPEQDAGVSFFVCQPVEVHKFNDLDGDGIRDAGEPEIIGTWDVVIEGPSGIVYDGTMPTLDLCVRPDGTYTVTETLQDGWQVTTPPGNPSVEQEFEVPQADPCVIVIEVGNQQLGQLQVQKFNDLDGDGSWDQGEPALTGWHVVVEDSENNTIYNGNMPVTLDDLAPGTYTATETVQDGWENTTDVTQSADVTTGGIATIEFGNREMTSSLTVRKFNDRNQDGNRDAGEEELTGWHVVVEDSENNTIYNGDMPVTLDDLDTGTYSATETLQTDWTNTTPLTQTITLEPGESGTIWFGNYLPTPTLVPTLGQWGIIAMSSIFVLLLAWAISRRRKQGIA